MEVSSTAGSQGEKKKSGKEVCRWLEKKKKKEKQNTVGRHCHNEKGAIDDGIVEAGEMQMRPILGLPVHRSVT